MCRPDLTVCRRGARGRPGLWRTPGPSLSQVGARGAAAGCLIVNDANLAGRPERLAVASRRRRPTYIGLIGHIGQMSSSGRRQTPDNALHSSPD